MMQGQSEGLLSRAAAAAELSVVASSPLSSPFRRTAKHTLHVGASPVRGQGAAGASMMQVPKKSPTKELLQQENVRLQSMLAEAESKLRQSAELGCARGPRRHHE